MDFVPNNLTFNISHSKCPVILSIKENSTHNNEQLGVWLIKINQILSILQSF